MLQVRRLGSEHAEHIRVQGNPDWHVSQQIYPLHKKFCFIKHHMLSLCFWQVNGQIEKLLRRQQDLQRKHNTLLQKVETNRRAPKADWSGTFEWDEMGKQILNDMFKLASFRYLDATFCHLALQHYLPGHKAIQHRHL